MTNLKATKSNLRRFFLLLASSLALAWAAACSTDPPDRVDRDPGPGLGVSAAALMPSDVAKMEFRVYECGGGLVDTKTADIEPIKLPGGIETFEGRPYDKESRHSFADRYFLLEAGCYDVEAQPLDASGAPSSDCDLARATDQKVEDGETTEILLISQCKGPEKGGLDVIASVNHPPHLEKLRFNPAKFVACPQTVQICVDAEDPDYDPMRSEWSILSGPTPLSPLQVIATQQTDGEYTQCVKFKPGVGDFTLKVTVWDRLWDGGVLEDFEEYFTRIGNPQQSRDELVFPVYGATGACGPDAGDDTGRPDVGMDTGVDVGVDVGHDTSFPDVSIDASPDVETDGGTTGCTRTQGYWGTHHDFATNPSQNIDWPAPEDEEATICSLEWLNILKSTPATGDTWTNLAQQWIAASLNAADGTTVPAHIQQAIADAEAILLANCGSIPVADKPNAEAIKNLLDSYNNGGEGVPKCP